MTNPKTVLFKTRGFGDYLSDTFTFLKQEGKDFFKTFIYFYGGYFIFLLFLIYILVDLFYNSATTSTTTEIDVMIANNFELSAIIVLITIILTLFLSVIVFTYPVLYMKNMIDFPDTYQDQVRIKKQLKQCLKRGVSFMILTSILATPIVLIAYSIAAVLMFLIIGIPILLLIGPYATSIISLAYSDYVVRQSDFFDSYKMAFKLSSKDFWGNLGNSFVFLMIIQFIGYMTIMVPNAIYSLGILVSEANTAELERLGYQKIIMAIIILLTSMISCILYLVYLINQGLVYYSSRERIESYQSMLDIETIGQNNE